MDESGYLKTEITRS